MQNTLVNVTPDATTDCATINAGEVISDTFFAPVETDVIDGLLGRYGLMYAKLKTISATVREGENADAVEYFMRGNVRNSRLHMPPVRVVFDLPGAVASLNADFWQQALNLTDVYEYMPNDRRNEWNNQIHEMKAPDFEENAVRATLSELLFSRQKFFSERVDGIFRSLSRSHVTNRPEGFSKRMIIECMFDQWGMCNYERTGYVDDLRKVIAKFMGRDANGLNTTNKILNIARARSGEWVVIDGGALRVKAFLKGTIHLEIHPDMAWRLNDILAFLHPFSPLHCRVLEAKGHNVIEADFLQWSQMTPQRFDVVVMNPPYSEGRAVAHLNAAAALVKDGGRLAVILPAGSDRKDLLPGWDCNWSAPIEGMFAGTGVRVVRLMAYKPE